MRHLSRGFGFTLIELMVALAIIAITSAFAVPAFQDYIGRARVSEGMSLATSARLAVGENATVMAPTLDSGYVAPAATTNVSSLEIAPKTGQITITFSERVAPATANVLVLVPSVVSAAGVRQALVAGQVSDGQLAWECFAAGKVGSAGSGPGPLIPATLPGKFAAAACRP